MLHKVSGRLRSTNDQPESSGNNGNSLSSVGVCTRYSSEPGVTSQLHPLRPYVFCWNIHHRLTSFDRSESEPPGRCYQMLKQQANGCGREKSLLRNRRPHVCRGDCPFLSIVRGLSSCMNAETNPRLLAESSHRHYYKRYMLVTIRILVCSLAAPQSLSVIVQSTFT
jgi:hypothetical protein